MQERWKRGKPLPRCYKDFNGAEKKSYFNSIPKLLLKLLMNLPDLFFNVGGLHMLHANGVGRVDLAVVTRRRLLPSCGFLIRDGLAGDTVEDVGPLTGKTFEIVGHVCGGEVCGRIAGVCFGFLFLPTRVKEFNYEDKKGQVVSIIVFVEQKMTTILI